MPRNVCNAQKRNIPHDEWIIPGCHSGAGKLSVACRPAGHNRFGGRGVKQKEGFQFRLGMIRLEHDIAERKILHKINEGFLVQAPCVRHTWCKFVSVAGHC